MVDVLEARNLTKRYWDFTLEDVSITIPEGRIVGLVGPSGAGKTTLIKLIMNLLPTDGGTITVFGLDHADSEKAIKNRIGFVSEQPGFIKRRDIAWTGGFVAEFFERWDGTRFTELLRDFGLSPDKKVDELSRGQKTMLAVAIACSHDADLLILDEPTAGLDLMVRRRVLKLLRELAEVEEKTVLLSSHNTDGLREIAHRIVFLDRGRVILEEDMEDLMARWKWLHFRNGAIEPELETALTSVERRAIGNVGLVTDYPAVRETFALKVAAGEVVVENASLDDILISLVQERSN